MTAATRVKHIAPIDLLALHSHNPDRYPYLLQSVADSPLSQYDILFAFPQQRIELNAQGVSTHACSTTLQSPFELKTGLGFLDSLQAWFQAEQQVPPKHSHSPFRGGWFLYLGYELTHEVEPSISLRSNEEGTPFALASRIPCAIIHNRRTNRSRIVCEQQYEHLIQELLQDIANMAAYEPQAVEVDNLTQDEPEKYLAAVARAKQYIYDGDIFQANLSQRWAAASSASAVDVYASLCKSNPAPFAGLVHHQHGAIISSSPERLLRIKHGKSGSRIDVRPIAGTRPRGNDAAADKKLKRALIQHPKERAEHVMLIDLERNDIGRVCQPGTVHVNELMVLETYTHVHHIVSNITGILRQDANPIHAIRACFPGGTITGCPKVRCIEIIDELEAQGRGAYTGSMGYLNLDGSMDTNILIRTIVKNEKQLSLRAGAGIVIDSDPEKELKETSAKALGMLNALTGEHEK